MNYFTYYLSNGDRRVFLGFERIDAYTANQSYTDSKRVIDYIEDGITNTYYWTDYQWLEKQPLQIQTIFKTEQGTAELLDIDPLLLDKHLYLDYVFESKKRLRIRREWLRKPYGWVHVIAIRFLSPTADENTFSVVNSCYFHPDNAVTALIVFLTRTESSQPQKCASHPSTLTLEELYEQQTADDVYGYSLNEREGLWLLGSLLIRWTLLTPHAPNEVPDREIYPELHELYRHLQFYCRKYLLTDTTERHYDNEKYLRTHFKLECIAQWSNEKQAIERFIKLSTGRFIYG